MNVNKKIKKLIGEGRKKTQAVAIALSMKEAAKKKKESKKLKVRKMASLGVRG
jgi:hypothetical protein